MSSQFHRYIGTWMFVVRQFRSFSRARLRLVSLVLGMTTGLPIDAVADPWPTECKLSLQASLPFRFERGHIRIEVRVNGIPRTFIVDTGGALSSISADVVESQKIKSRPIAENIDFTGIGGQRAERYAIADTLTFGHLRANDVRLIVQPPDNAAEEDGVIGPDYLRNFDIEIDYSKKIVNFFRPHPCAGRAVYWSDIFDSTDLAVTPQGHIRLDMQLDDKEIPALLDTGSPASLIDKLSVPPAAGEEKTPDTVTILGATGGAAETIPHKFRGLRLGTLLIANPTLLITSYHETFRDDEARMLLGNKELKLFHIYIAYQEHKMYFTPNRN